LQCPTLSGIMQFYLVILLAAVASSAPVSETHTTLYLNKDAAVAVVPVEVVETVQVPVVKTVQVPVVQTSVQFTPGYVAATPGNVHTAPLPEGPSGDGLYASHHINLPDMIKQEVIVVKAAAPEVVLAKAVVPEIVVPKAVVKTTAEITPGYVAATHGTVHTAPLPEGPSGDGFYASHHINLPDVKADQ